MALKVQYKLNAVLHGPVSKKFLAKFENLLTLLSFGNELQLLHETKNLIKNSMHIIILHNFVQIAIRI